MTTDSRYAPSVVEFIYLTINFYFCFQIRQQPDIRRVFWRDQQFGKVLNMTVIVGTVEFLGKQR